MEKAIIDVSKKKNIKIINSGRKVEDMERKLFGAYG